MEVFCFLKQRTTFIRHHYETASIPFRDIIRKVELEEDPYKPTYSEDDGEPPFQEDWIEANTSLEILGVSCISMLSSALKLYFLTWEQELGIKCQKHCPKIFNGKGFVAGYKICFGDILETDWNKCPADFSIIEQIVLARNDAQHPKDVTDLRLRHNGKLRENNPLPFFLSDQEKTLIEIKEYQEFPWLNLSLIVTHEKLFEAIKQVELLGEWMEEQLFDVKNRRR